MHRDFADKIFCKMKKLCIKEIIMTKKVSFILSLFSILSPVLLILLVILITLTENFFRTMHINNPFIPFFIFWIVYRDFRSCIFDKVKKKIKKILLGSLLFVFWE